MTRMLGYCVAAAAAMAALPASATDIKFSFKEFNLTGILYGLQDNDTSTPTSVVITSTPDQIKLGKTLTLWDRKPTPEYPGISLQDGGVIKAQTKLGLQDESKRQITLLLNSSNRFGSDTGFFDVYERSPSGQGRSTHLAGHVHYSLVQSAVPEPASWMLMILGFGIVGYVLRQRASHPRRVQLA